LSAYNSKVDKFSNSFITLVSTTVEVNVDKGIGYYLVGLPDNAIKESSHQI